MNINVHTSVTVERSREDVASFVMDPANDLRWIGALSEVRLLDGGSVTVGSRVQRIAHFLGKRIEYVNQVDELIPGRRLAMHSVRAPFEMTVVYDFEDVAEGGTRVTVEAGGETAGYYRLAGPLLPLFVRAGIRRDLRNLKKALEEA